MTAAITNAEHHITTHGGGTWRTSTIVRRCDRYFGHVAACRLGIRRGERFFDTEVAVSNSRPGSHKITCHACASAPAFCLPAAARVASAARQARTAQPGARP